MSHKREYCGLCYLIFGTAEPRKHQDGKVYHSCCFKRMELQELIVKEVRREKHNVRLAFDG